MSFLVMDPLRDAAAIYRARFAVRLQGMSAAGVAEPGLNAREGDQLERAR
jgi:hypothetical protein